MTCPHTFNESGYCKLCGFKSTPNTFTPNAITAWPSDTWFQRALARRKRLDAEEIAHKSKGRLL